MTSTDDRTTVWFLIGRLSVGGTERTLVDLANGLDRERFAPSIWTITDPGPLADDLDDDVTIRPLSASNKLDPGPFFRLSRAVQRERPAVLQSFLYFDNVLARVVGVLSPETAVFTGVREVPDSMPLQRDLIDRLTLPLSDLIVSNSEAGAKWVIERGADPEEVSVVPNGRKVDAYDVPEPEGLRSSLGLGTGPVVGTVGRLVERKGHHDLLKAWPRVLNEHPNAELVIVGGGPERDRLDDHTRRLDIAESVHFLGTRDDVPELLAMFDVFAFPSHYEGMPGALLEAMCAELPIVTTPVDGCSELITDDEHGVHVPPQDSEALAHAIITLLSDDEKASLLGRAAGARAHSEYSVDAMVDRFERLYLESS
ncbi:glycosyltransferase [Halobaculum sp. EA56]|uniref:glycosyltransferase n=1 Tax=Halobaculum sp. EA56 TaxID=3421648 RepID=UPI003EBF1251